MDARPNADSIGGGRRIISILFCDVRSSTETAGRLDPEEWAEIMNGAFERIVQPIYRYEGTVVRLLGDAVLAFFGAPIAREDDPQRAVLAGLEIQEAIQGYADTVAADWGVGFSVRCGINTGLVVVGAFGGSQYSEYTAMGGAVNLAARMEQTAKPGTVQISEATYRLVAPLFEVENLGAISVKGIEEPQRAYRVIRRRMKRATPRSISEAQTPMVGRGIEFATLVESVERLQRGSGGIVFLVGEAGLGKSRLVYELERYTTNLYAETRWLQTGSFSYERAQPYAMIQRLMLDVCGITDSDTPAAKRDKIAATFSELTLREPEETQSTLEVLFGVADGAITPNRLEGEAFKGSLYAVMIPLWLKLGESGPLVVVFDDMQWADAASAALIEHGLDKIGDAPILMICAMRPSRQSAGESLLQFAVEKLGSHLRTITLQPLSAAENEELLNRLLPADAATEPMRQQILEKGAGTPLFVEEVVRVLTDGSHAVVSRSVSDRRSAGSVNSLQVPDNLESLLVARIDHLSADVRDTLLLASVLGPVVDFRLLTRISVRDEETLAEHMQQLAEQGLLRRTDSTPEPEYRFVHVLLQETAYRMILRRQRRQYHLRVAEAMEKTYTQKVDEKAVLLAYHFDQASDTQRAARYYGIAGDAAFRLYSLKDAAAHFSRALELEKTLNPDRVTEERASLYVSMGRTLELDTRYHDALAVYDEMEEAAREDGNQRLALDAMVARLPLYSVPTSLFDSELAREQGDNALRLARELGDREAESRLLWSLSNAHALVNDLDIATEYGESSLALATKLGLRDQMARTLLDLGLFCHTEAGRLDKAREALGKASEICREIEDMPMLSDSLASLALVSYIAGDYDASLDYASEAQIISESIHNLWGQSYSRYKIGLIYWERGDPDRAIDTIQTCLRLGNQAGFLASQVEPNVDLATIYANLGDYACAHDALDRALAIPSTRHLPEHAYVLAVEIRLMLLSGDITGAAKKLEMHQESHAESTWPAYGVRLTAADTEIALAQEDFSRAADLSNVLLDQLREYKMRSQVPFAFLLRSRALTGLGKREETRAALQEARTEAEALSAKWMLWQILYGLARIQGDASEGARLLSQARDIIADITRHVNNPELRERFLSTPAIVAILDGVADA